MSTDIEVHQSTALAIEPEQTSFTPAQVTTLAHIGVENASPADIEVFFHVCKRTGLDPFAKQIYMIGRKSQGKWKQTIQTGIDGYRLIGRRAANETHGTISVKPPKWGHPDGGWREVWMNVWGHPVAAQVTVVRSGEEFTATALFDEYKQTKYEGDLTAMWKQRPAGQIAKCAEALAWRMAFPQDLSGIYVDEEMEQADNRRTVHAETSSKDRVRAAVTAQPEAEESEPVDVSDTELVPDPISAAQIKKLSALVTDLGLTRDQKISGVASIVERDIETTKDLTKDEATKVIRALKEALDQRGEQADNDSTSSKES